MYKRARQQAAFTDFNQAAGLNLNPENRWIKYSQMIPWESMEEKYAELFPAKVGYPAKPFRLVMGALLIQQAYNCPDRELVKMIQENPYMQYFCGYREYDSSKEPFNASALVGFRKRLTLDILSDFNNMVIDLDLGILKLPEESGGDPNDSDPPSADGMDTNDGHPALGSDETASAPNSEEDLPTDDGADCTADTSADEAEAATTTDSPNSGTLIIDATCAPSNIRFPQDTSLLNEAREKAEGIVDRLHEQTGGEKPRTYRIKAAKQYKSFVRRRRPTRKDRRKAIRRQLGYLKRDLEAIEKLRSAGAALSEKDTELLDTLQKVYEQQKYMYDNKTHHVADRIVSIEQPYIRPIVRGKVKDPTEFGAKVHMSLDENGYARFDHTSWDAFNEGTLLEESVEAYRQREGHYPERVLADKIYRNRANLKYCKEHGIRLMGPPLGRPRKTAEQDREIARKDGIDRIEVERQFSLAKRCCGLGTIWTRRKETSECSLGLSLIALNLKNIFNKSALFLPFLQKSCVSIVFRYKFCFSRVWGRPASA